MNGRRGPTGVTRQAVLDYLIREADLDGLVTVSEKEIGEAVGVERVTVAGHLRNLADAGVLTIDQAAAGFTSMNAIQLAEDVFA